MAFEGRHEEEIAVELSKQERAWAEGRLPVGTPVVVQPLSGPSYRATVVSNEQAFPAYPVKADKGYGLTGWYAVKREDGTVWDALVAIVSVA